MGISNDYINYYTNSYYFMEGNLKMKDDEEYKSQKAVMNVGDLLSIEPEKLKALQGQERLQIFSHSESAILNSFKNNNKDLTASSQISEAFRKLNETVSSSSYSSIVGNQADSILNNFVSKNDLAYRILHESVAESTISDSFRKLNETINSSSYASIVGNQTDSILKNFVSKNDLAFRVLHDSVSEQIATFSKQTESLNSVFPRSVRNIVDSIASTEATFERLAGFTGSFSQHMIGNTCASDSTLESLSRTFSEASAYFIQNPEKLSLISGSLEENEDAFAEEELETSISNCPDYKEPASFQEKFSKLPPWIKLIFLYILLHVIEPQINSISANLLTPHVEQFLDGNDEAATQKIKKIKKIPITVEGIRTDSLRFITGDNVRLRASPSTQSEIIDELRLGQVVVVCLKQRNWIEVSVEYEAGVVKRGWVFTRYTSKFKY